MPIPNYAYRVAWSSEDRAYVATCAELDGLSGLGDSAEAALAELRVAVELAIEQFTASGTDVPRPNPAPSHSGQFRLRLPKSVHARLAARAETEGVSLNTLIMTYVAMGLGEADALRRGRIVRAARHAG
jgi:predicted HicB family RNase H-like nuclease